MGFAHPQQAVCRRGGEEADLLVVGTATDLVVFDVYNNTEVFYKQMDDGVSALCVGPVEAGGPPIIFAGGNCSITGFR